MSAEEEEDEDKCRCGAEAEELHPCPFSEEIHNDFDTLCNCCKHCQRECARDI